MILLHIFFVRFFSEEKIMTKIFKLGLAGSALIATAGSLSTLSSGLTIAHASEAQATNKEGTYSKKVSLVDESGKQVGTATLTRKVGAFNLIQSSLSNDIPSGYGVLRSNNLDNYPDTIKVAKKEQAGSTTKQVKILDEQGKQIATGTLTKKVDNLGNYSVSISGLPKDYQLTKGSDILKSLPDQVEIKKASHVSRPDYSLPDYLTTTYVDNFRNPALDKSNYVHTYTKQVKLVDEQGNSLGNATLTKQFTDLSKYPYQETHDPKVSIADSGFVGLDNMPQGYTFSKVQREALGNYNTNLPDQVVLTKVTDADKDKPSNSFKLYNADKYTEFNYKQIKLVDEQGNSLGTTGFTALHYFLHGAYTPTEPYNERSFSVPFPSMTVTPDKLPKGYVINLYTNKLFNLDASLPDQVVLTKATDSNKDYTQDPYINRDEHHYTKQVKLVDEQGNVIDTISVTKEVSTDIGGVHGTVVTDAPVHPIRTGSMTGIRIPAGYKIAPNQAMPNSDTDDNDIPDKILLVKEDTANTGKTDNTGSSTGKDSQSQQSGTTTDQDRTNNSKTTADPNKEQTGNTAQSGNTGSTTDQKGNTSTTTPTDGKQSSTDTGNTTKTDNNDAQDNQQGTTAGKADSQNGQAQQGTVDQGKTDSKTTDNQGQQQSGDATQGSNTTTGNNTQNSGNVTDSNGNTTANNASTSTGTATDKKDDTKNSSTVQNSSANDNTTASNATDKAKSDSSVASGQSNAGTAKTAETADKAVTGKTAKTAPTAKPVDTAKTGETANVASTADIAKKLVASTKSAGQSNNSTDSDGQKAGNVVKAVASTKQSKSSDSSQSSKDHDNTGSAQNDGSSVKLSSADSNSDSEATLPQTGNSKSTAGILAGTALVATMATLGITRRKRV